MSANRRRHINALPGLKLFVGFSVGAIVLLTGLGYVYCQNELHRMLGEVGRLEKEYQRLRTMSDVVEVNISKLTAPQELRKRMNNGFFKLSEITDDRIVRIAAPAKGVAGEVNELRPVAHERKTQ